MPDFHEIKGKNMPNLHENQGIISLNLHEIKGKNIPDFHEIEVTNYFRLNATIFVQPTKVGSLLPN